MHRTGSRDCTVGFHLSRDRCDSSPVSGVGRTTSTYSLMSGPEQPALVPGVAQAPLPVTFGEVDHTSRVAKLLEGALFQSFMASVIMFNALLMGMETDVEWIGWSIMEKILLCIYCVELGLKLQCEGTRLLSCHNPDILWNILDVVIVAFAVVDTWIVGLLFSTTAHGPRGHSIGKTQHQSSSGQMVVLMRMLRLLRILRLAKLVKAVRPLYVLVASIVAALQGVAWVFLLTLTLLYAMAIVTTRLAGHGLIWPNGNEPEEIMQSFRTVADSMFTLFRLMTGMPSETEQVAVDQLMDSLPFTRFSFIFFVVSSTWILLSTLTAVISENMITTAQQQKQELALASADEDHENRIQQLQELFDFMAEEDLREEDLARILENKEFATRVALSCRVTVKETEAVLKALHRESAVVTKDMFVDHLLSVSEPCTEKTILQLEARITEFQRRTESALSGLSSDLRQRSKFEEALVERVTSSLDQVLKVNSLDAAQICTSLRELLQGQADLEQRIVTGFNGSLDLTILDPERITAEAAAGVTEEVASTRGMKLEELWSAVDEIVRESSAGGPRQKEYHRIEEVVNPGRRLHVAQLLARVDSSLEAHQVRRCPSLPTFIDSTTGSSRSSTLVRPLAQEAPSKDGLSSEKAVQQGAAIPNAEGPKALHARLQS